MSNWDEVIQCYTTQISSIADRFYEHTSPEDTTYYRDIKQRIDKIKEHTQYIDQECIKIYDNLSVRHYKSISTRMQDIKNACRLIFDISDVPDVSGQFHEIYQSFLRAIYHVSRELHKVVNDGIVQFEKAI